MDSNLRNRLLPGGALLGENNRWEPAIPRDMTAAPPPVVDGQAKCEQCTKAFPLTALEITQWGYSCGACAAAQVAGPPVDASNVKVGRGRWWIMPIVIAVGAAITIVAPGAVLVTALVVAAITLRLFLRRGL
jgi:hypothetical protein